MNVRTFAGSHKKQLLAGVVLGLGVSLLSSTAGATVLNYAVTFQELNNSGVSGGGTLSFDNVSNLLNVNYTVDGLEAGLHPQHIHGLFEEGIGVPGGTPLNSMVPTIADDADGDGLIEVLEAAASYGDILLSLSQTPGGGDFSSAGGMFTYNQMFDLNDMNVFQPPSIATTNVYSMADLFPLDLREIVIHGATVAGEGFRATLPIAAAEIERVAEPGTLGMLALGLGTLGLAGYRRRRLVALVPA